ncbi:MAG TPA: hypothetical protein VJS37_11265 [Terriglobales bacterium]|nr:hypothetical protein [Terriglobales bacterium]
MKFKISQSLIGLTALAATSSIVALGAIAGPPEQSKAAIVLADQGSFMVGGTFVTNPGTFDPVASTPDGQTIHGDHAYVQERP